MVSVSLSDFEALGFSCVCLAFAALELFTFLLDSAEAPLLHSAAEVLLPLFAVAVLFVAVAFTYRHLSLSGRHAAAAPVVAGASNGRRSTSGSGRLLMFVLCVSVAALEFVVFGGQAAGGSGAEEDHGAQQARALGLAALRALPATATATFFLGMMMLTVAAHVRAGGEGGGTTGAVAGAGAGHGPVQGLVLRLLTKLAAGAAAALFGLMAMAFVLYGAKY